MKETDPHKEFFIAMANGDHETITKYFMNAPLDELGKMAARLHYSARAVDDMYLQRLEFEKGN